jgi:hypothetical protein
VVPLAESVSV